MDIGPHNNSIQLIILQIGDENLINRVFSITKNLNLSHQLLISNNSNLNVVLAILHNRRLTMAKKLEYITTIRTLINNNEKFASLINFRLENGKSNYSIPLIHYYDSITND